MRRYILYIGSLFLVLVRSSPQVLAVEINSQQIDITASTSYVTRYIWRGQDLYGDDDPAVQPSIDVALPESFLGSDIAFNVWGSFPLNGGHDDGTELDYVLTLSRDVLDGAVNLSAGYTYFDFPRAGGTWDIQEPWVSLGINEIPALPVAVSFSIFAGYDLKAASGGPDEGWYYSWGFTADIPLPECALFQQDQALSFGVTNWGNDGVAGLEPSAFYATELSLSTSYAFSNVSISPSLNYTINHESAINSGDEEIWGGLEVSVAL